MPPIHAVESVRRDKSELPLGQIEAPRRAKPKDYELHLIVIVVSVVAILAVIVAGYVKAVLG
jgi:hypothetical protein